MRRELVDALAGDGLAALAVLEGQEPGDAVSRAGALLATVVGQDLETAEDGVFRIARRVAKDRVISTVDPETRHGHKTAARGFDGYKGHVAMDPDSEIITATGVTAGNTGDAEPAPGLLAADVNTPAPPAAGDDDNGADVPGSDGQGSPVPGNGGPVDGDQGSDGQASSGPDGEALAVYGDAAYGAGALLAELEKAGASVMVKVQPPVAPAGRYAKDRFAIDTAAGTVTCPAHQGPHHAAGPGLAGRIRATRPKVERRIGHLMRRKHGGRRARVRGRTKVAADFSLLAAATNLARLAMLGITRTTREGWVIAPA